ncbi:MAG: DUF1153 domain-containing protein [Gammaproteobacteria bacterium]|nr:DUF1153 domain-containing protein [Gammaproteobacteria bacterium]MDH3379967.1 DUF1153 domain-containing protein [Gammaproteobacteria bacterium]
MNISELPAPGVMRWTNRRKAAVVVGVREGQITFDEARKRYKLSFEEFISWQRLIDNPRN